MQDVNDSNFVDEVLKSDKAVVDFWAEWCGPCRILDPRFEKLSEVMKDIKFFKLNVDENQATSANYGVRSIPTILAFKKGEKVGEIIGAMPEDILKQKIEQSFN
jgi:thioredoxin 1